MTGSLSDLNPFAVTAALLVLLCAGWAVGWFMGRRKPRDSRDEGARRVTDATLALMGLLLAFTFAMALERYDRRRDAVVADSNSIADFYTCVSLLNDAQVRAPLQKVTREYTKHRSELAGRPVGEVNLEEEVKLVAEFHARMTELVGVAINRSGGTPLAMPLVQTLNNLTSSHMSRLISLRDRLPPSIVVLLFLATVVSISLLGWQQGAVGRPHWYSTLGFILLVAAAVYTTLDLNSPQRGLIRTTNEPLERLLASMADGGGAAGGGNVGSPP
jgi:hypothetical protein